MGISNTIDLVGIASTYYYSVPLRNKAGATVAPLPTGFAGALTSDEPAGDEKSCRGAQQRGALGLLSALLAGLVLGWALGRAQRWPHS